MIKRFFLLAFILLFAVVPQVIAQDKTVEKEQEAAASPEIEIRDADEAYQLYADFVNGYLERDSVEEWEKYAQDNMDKVLWIGKYLHKYISEFTPDQFESIKSLALMLSEKTDAILRKNTEEIPETDMVDSLSEDMDIIQSDYNEVREPYLDCLEDKIKSTLLPTRSLFYLNEEYLEAVRDSCAQIVARQRFCTDIEYSLDAKQKVRLQELLYMCKVGSEDAIALNGFDTSPDAVILEINAYYENAEKATEYKPLHLYQSYVKLLAELVLKENGKNFILSDKQKDDFLTAIFKYLQKEYELNLQNKYDCISISDCIDEDYTPDPKEFELYQSFHFETLDELIQLADIFYQNKLSKVKSKEELNDEDEKYAREVEDYISAILRNDFISGFIDDNRMSKLRNLDEKYDERR